MLEKYIIILTVECHAPKSGAALAKKMQKSPKKPRFSAFSSDCHNLTFAVCIFVRARFYANDIPYNFGDFGPFRGWRRRGCLCHHLAVEGSAVPDFRGDFRIFNVL